MKLIVGLGNPGEKYLNTRHNIGFHTIEQLQKQLQFENFKEETKFKAAISAGQYQSEQIILAKPLTFMNLSGEAIQKIANFFKIETSNITVIYDDIDLPLGKIRLRPNGGSGTHNGMKSIIQHLGENFPRLRLGIETRGNITPEQIDLHDFVLGKFTPQEETLLAEISQKATKTIIAILEKGITEAMNEANQ